LSTSGVYVSSAELYDPAGGTWSTTGSLGVARYNHTATLLLAGSLLVAGGAATGGAYLASAQVFDSASGAWSAIHRSFAGACTRHTATLLLTGKVLIAGGYDNQIHDPGSRTLASAALYDPATNAWTVTGNLETARYHHTATLLANGKVLVVGSETPANANLAELYDPATGSWTATGSLATPRYGHTAIRLPSGKVLVTGGINSATGPQTAAELFDPATGTWSATGSLDKGRSDHTATLLPSGKVLVAGGRGSIGAPLAANTEIYDPATGLWSITPGTLITRRYSHTATLLPSGKVLAAGGQVSYNEFPPNAELFDPATGQWSATGSFVNSRKENPAVLLPNGKVLVAGGDNSFFGSVELYDPATGIWSVTGGFVTGEWENNVLGTAHREATVTLLPNGKVLTAGGFGPYNALATSELYDTGLGFPGTLRPQIESAVFDSAGRLLLTGTGFRGVSSNSGGNGSQDSPTGQPFVQLRLLENEQCVLLQADPATPATATAFTSVPVSYFPSRALVTVFVSGIPSASVMLGFPDIVVEQPAGSLLAGGGTRTIAALPGTPGSMVFTIRNPGNSDVTGLTITRDGPNASAFIVTASPTGPLPADGITTFTVQFAPPAGGAYSAVLHIANNVPGKHPYDINLTGKVLLFTTDTDGDGMNDASEFQMAALGFDWQVSQPALVAALFANAGGAGLFTASQVQTLNPGTRLLTRNAATGQFTLEIGMEKSADLTTFTPFPFLAPQTTIRPDGKLEFLFTVPDNAAFFRLQPQ